MKNFFLCGIIAIIFPICVQAQFDSSIQTDSSQTNLDSIQIIKEVQNDLSLIQLGNELIDARDSVWEAYSRVYENILLCDLSDDATFDTTCFLGLSQKLAKTRDVLSVYAKLIKQNESPIWIRGFKIYVTIEMNPPASADLEDIITKFGIAANDVIVCVRGRATEGPCSSVGLSVSDAVNSLGRVMGLMKK